MRARSESLTDLPISPDEDRERRFRTYVWLMAARVAALAVFFVVPGWWKLVPALFAVFVPYFAVVIANQSTRPGAQGRIAPNALPPGPSPRIPSAPAPSAPAPSAPGPTP